jgi:hypothetical protein
MTSTECTTDKCTTNECTICMEEKTDFTMLRCAHALCTSCYDEVNRRSRKCPFCREPFVLESNTHHRDRWQEFQVFLQQNALARPTRVLDAISHQEQVNRATLLQNRNQPRQEFIDSVTEYLRNQPANRNNINGYIINNDNIITNNYIINYNNTIINNIN